MLRRPRAVGRLPPRPAAGGAGSSALRNRAPAARRSPRSRPPALQAEGAGVGMVLGVVRWAFIQNPQDRAWPRAMGRRPSGAASPPRPLPAAVTNPAVRKAIRAVPISAVRSHAAPRRLGRRPTRSPCPACAGCVRQPGPPLPRGHALCRGLSRHRRHAELRDRRRARGGGHRLLHPLRPRRRRLRPLPRRHLTPGQAGVRTPSPPPPRAPRGPAARDPSRSSEKRSLSLRTPDDYRKVYQWRSRPVDVASEVQSEEA